MRVIGHDVSVLKKTGIWKIPLVWLSRAHVQHAVGVIEIIKFVGDCSKLVMSLFGVTLSAFGTWTAFSGGAAQIPALNLDKAGLPVKLLVLIVIACSLGFILSALVNYVVRHQGDGQGVLVVLLAIVVGVLLVGSADWIAKPLERRVSSFSETALFASVATCLAAQVAIYGFRDKEVSEFAVDMRSLALMVFAVTVFAVVLMTISLPGQ